MLFTNQLQLARIFMKLYLSFLSNLHVIFKHVELILKKRDELNARQEVHLPHTDSERETHRELPPASQQRNKQKIYVTHHSQ